MVVLLPESGRLLSVRAFLQPAVATCAAAFALTTVICGRGSACHLLWQASAKPASLRRQNIVDFPAEHFHA
jgi:hypothetical protein